MTVGQINEMSMSEYMGWIEFYEVEPWGLAVADLLNAQTSTVLANLKRDSKSRPEPYARKDFLVFPAPVPEASESPEPTTVDGKTAEQWQMIFAAESLQALQDKRAGKIEGPSLEK